MDNGIMIYHNCIACRKGWCNKSTAKIRVDWATAKKKSISTSELLVLCQIRRGQLWLEFSRQTMDYSEAWKEILLEMHRTC